MSLTRRDFLKLATFFSSAAALNACAPALRGFANKTPLNLLSAVEFTALNRITFGAKMEERARFAEIGLQAYIEEQLAFESINDLTLGLQLSNFSTLNMSANEIEAITNELFDGYNRRRPIHELRQATFLRQLYSQRQLYEVMVDFWSDHFNIFIEKEPIFYLKTVDDREVIRKHALGNFRDLLWASAHSPAMLTYLDNQANVKGAPNENYARELMELHTLGVNGGYTQNDVMQLARCLTGWSVKKHFWLGEFVFKPKQHADGVKNVLGLAIQESGQHEAEQVIEHLALHPSTAKFICAKLARRFIADNPPQEIIEKAAQAFLATKGDIKSVLRVILFDGLAFAQPKYKRPLNFVLSALRALNAEANGATLFKPLLRMGQLYFNWTTPDGYPDASEAWQGNLMPRWQFAFELIRNEIPKTTCDLNALLDVSPTGSLQSNADTLASLLLGAPLDRLFLNRMLDTIHSTEAAPEETLQIIAASLIASPAFQWR
ncbi:MAG: DUF1800 domain-containing protein [Anaerolineales bacterium]|nr:DUF1800 domain-containing protein [Anaerolineales bacterium]